VQVPLCSSVQVINALKRNGFVRGPVKRGSHQSYVRELASGRKITVTVIEGRKEIPRPTLKQILRRAGKSTEHFLELLK